MVYGTLSRNLASPILCIGPKWETSISFNYLSLEHGVIGIMSELDELRSNISIVAQATTKMVGDLNNYQDGTSDRQLLIKRFQLQRAVIERALEDVYMKLTHKE